MKVIDLRNKFITYFSQKYKFIDGESLVSNFFPTTFTLSGGPNFIDLILKNGRAIEIKHENKNILSIQRCLRSWDVAHVDDGRHLSFFEMAVTSCIEGYSRQEQYSHHLAFFKEIGLDFGKLWISYFGGGNVKGKEFPPDAEAFEIWNHLGIGKERIIPLDGEHAFVANSVEPIGGPRTEMHYEMENRIGKCQPKCIPGICNCGKFIEFWTSVLYSQYVQTSQLERSEIYQFKQIDKNLVAAGFGVERLNQIINGYQTIYEVDTIEPIVEKFHKYLLKESIPKSTNDKKYVIQIVEHIRGLTFLAADGAFQLKGAKNSSRKSVLNQYLKKFFFPLLTLEINQLYLLEALVNLVIETYAPIYPYLNGNKDYVVKEIQERAKRLSLPLK